MTFSTAKIILGGFLLLLFLAAINSYRSKRRSGQQQSAAAHLFAPVSAARSDFWAALCLLFAGAAIVCSCWLHFSVALADPAAGSPAPGLFFLLDCSASMLSDGIVASRIVEARSLIADLAVRHPHLPTSLVTFADNAMLDFPPSLAEGGFLDALSTAAPGLGFIPGSSPGAALRLGQDTAQVSKVQPMMILLSDGEVNVAEFAQEQALWTARVAPLLIIVVGQLEKPCPIPWQGGLMIDPDTGATALSKSSASQLSALASLAPAPWQLLANPDLETAAKHLQLLLKAQGERRDLQGRLLLSKIAILVALGLLAIWMLLRQGALKVRQSQQLLKLASSPTIACLLIAATNVQAQTEIKTDGTSPAVAETAARQEEIAQQLANDKLSDAERARLLSNWAALLIDDDKMEGDQEKARQDTGEAVKLCREALRLRPELPAAMINLTAARQKLHRLATKPPVLEEELAGGGAAAEEGANESPTMQKDNRKPEDLDTTATANQETRPQTGKITNLTTAEIITTENKDADGNEITDRGGTWRQMQKKRQVIPGRKPGMKPW